MGGCGGRGHEIPETGLTRLCGYAANTKPNHVPSAALMGAGTQPGVQSSAVFARTPNSRQLTLTTEIPSISEAVCEVFFPCTTYKNKPQSLPRSPGKVHVETALHGHYLPIKMAKIQNADAARCWKGCGVVEPSLTADNAEGHDHSARRLGSVPQNETSITVRSSDHPSWYFPKAAETHVCVKT